MVARAAIAAPLKMVFIETPSKASASAPVEIAPDIRNGPGAPPGDNKVTNICKQTNARLTADEQRLTELRALVAKDTSEACGASPPGSSTGHKVSIGTAAPSPGSDSEN